MTRSLSPGVITVASAVVLWLTGCSGGSTTLTVPVSPSAAPSLSTGASAASTAPLTGPELLWLQAVDREQSKINSALGKLPTTPTKAQMLALASVLRGCTTIMTRLGRPTDPRLLPVFEPMMKACAQFAKAAKCQTTIAVGNDLAKLNKAASCTSATTSTGSKEMATAENAILQLQHPSSSAPAASSSATTAGGLRPLPSHLFGLSINTGPAARRIADQFRRIADKFIARPASRGFRSPQAALYGRVGSGPAFVVYGARLATQGANPAPDLALAGLFVQVFTQAVGSTKGRLFPAGPHGGALVCGHGIQSGVPRFVCGWADQVTAGQVLYVSGAASSLSDAAAKTNQVRALIEP